jgi:hypothetical protein
VDHGPLVSVNRSSELCWTATLVACASVVACNALLDNAEGRLSGGGGATCASGADLYAVPVVTGAAIHIASEAGADAGTCSFGAVLDATSIDWVSGDRRTIKKVSKTGG